MGEGRKLIAGGIALVAALIVFSANAAGSPMPNVNPWLAQYGTLNMAHQGGEFEAPSSTMYAFHTALKDRGADSLELDVNATSDNRLAVMHDHYTSRITPLDAQVRNLTLAELQALDAAYWFSPGTGQFNHSKPDDQYPLRGVRTGAKPPPQGYTADDFRIPAIEEVLAAFPDVPINIEIKSVPGEPSESIRVATLLAEILNRPENRHHSNLGSRGVIVASLDQNALVKVNELAPQVDLSASITSMIGFIGSGLPIQPNPVALQVPMVLGELDVPKTLQELDARSKGYAVHAWTDGAGSENDESYAKLIDSGLQGIITSSPSVLHDYLCRAGDRRPDNSPRCDSQVMGFSLRYPSRSLRKYLKQGLPVRANCDQACSISLEVRMKKKAARRLGIKGKPRPIDRGLVLIGTQRRVSGPSRVGVNVFRASAFRQPFQRLARARKVTVEITVNVFDGSHWKQKVERRWLTLKSPRPLRRK